MPTDPAAVTSRAGSDGRAGTSRDATPDAGPSARRHDEPDVDARPAPRQEDGRDIPFSEPAAEEDIGRTSACGRDIAAAETTAEEQGVRRSIDSALAHRADPGVPPALLALQDPTGSALPAQSPQGGPHLPSATRHQLAAHLRNAAPGQSELTLDPVELGRLQITIRHEDGVALVHVAADRAATADLMRRHADLLMRELAEGGVESARLSFGDAGGGQGRAGTGREALPHARGPAADAPAPRPAPPPAAAQGGGGLDLRL